jgi:rhodanese-related sulfurtransferase
MNEKTQELLNKQDINSNELDELISLRENNKADFIIVDIREKFEIDEGYIKGCDLFVPTSNFMNSIDKFDKNKHIIFYCRSSARSGQVLSFMAQKGFDKISHLYGGISSYFGNIIR